LLLLYFVSFISFEFETLVSIDRPPRAPSEDEELVPSPACVELGTGIAISLSVDSKTDSSEFTATPPTIRTNQTAAVQLSVTPPNKVDPGIMLARWRTTATNALPSVDEEGSCRKEDDASNAQIIITKLQQENQQLRRELNDAYHRIRDLEGSLAVLIVSSADDDDDGTSASVEVQSVASMTDHLSMSSSTTTIPTGSALANKMREQQQKRDDLVMMI